MSAVAKLIIEFKAETPVSSIVGRNITSRKYFNRNSNVIACRNITHSIGITST